MAKPEEEVMEISDSGSDNGDPSLSDGSVFRSPSVEVVKGEERWRMSVPPPEVFDDGEWKFQIIGEEVDHKGEVLYEVEWDDWYRKDGSNTTWETADTITDIKWRPVQQKLRNEMASKSLSVDVITTTDIHNTETHLRQQAYQEKLKKYSKQKPPNYFNEMAKLMAKHQENVHPATSMQMPASQAAQGSQGSSSSPFTLRANQRASTRQQTEHSLAGTSAHTRGSSRLSSRSSVTLLSGTVNSSAMSRDPSLPSTSYASSKRSSSKILVHSVTPAPPKSLPTSSSSLKGKGKVVPVASSPEYTSSHDSISRSHFKSSTSFSLFSSPPSFNAAGKGRALSSPDSSDSEKAPSAISPSKNSRKRARYFVKSGSEDEDEDESVFVAKREPSPTPPPNIAQLSKNAAASSSSTESSLARRYRLEQAWTAQAQRVNAAPIYLVNDIDDEALPDLDPNFHYLETTYKFAPGIEKPPEEFLLRCSSKRCSKALLCECQHPSFMLDAKGIPFFAYQSGLFAFNVNKGIEVIECNKLCACAKRPSTCPNRVSQIPRKHPIEVFKTATRGWGVRSTKEIKRGQVLGTYTGLVITREAANALPGNLARYRFDLDGDEPEDEQGNEDTHGLYSVDSRLHGNWSRFINHSCSPNLQIYLVVHDTPPGIGLPYIAFVANQNIPIREELTFDYNPGQLSTIQDSGNPCHCGSSQCRGFLIF